MRGCSVVEFEMNKWVKQYIMNKMLVRTLPKLLIGNKKIETVNDFFEIMMTKYCGWGLDDKEYGEFSRLILSIDGIYNKETIDNIINKISDETKEDEIVSMIMRYLHKCQMKFDKVKGRTMKKIKTNYFKILKTETNMCYDVINMVIDHLEGEN